MTQKKRTAAQNCVQKKERRNQRDKEYRELPTIEDDGLYTTSESGAYLKFAPTTMRNSRCTGELSGVDAPAFIKMGTVVRYRGKTLKAWRNQFKEQLTTNNAGDRMPLRDAINAKCHDCIYGPIEAGSDAQQIACRMPTEQSVAKTSGLVGLDPMPRKSVQNGPPLSTTANSSGVTDAGLSETQVDPLRAETESHA